MNTDMEGSNSLAEDTDTIMDEADTSTFNCEGTCCNDSQGYAQLWKGERVEWSRYNFLQQKTIGTKRKRPYRSYKKAQVLRLFECYFILKMTVREASLESKVHRASSYKYIKKLKDADFPKT
ncbi:unnamed protein product [Mucor hiemalis]